MDTPRFSISSRVTVVLLVVEIPSNKAIFFRPHVSPTGCRQFPQEWGSFVGVSKNWADGVAATIGRAVRAQRGKRSGQWLANRTHELGMPIPRTTISELETGRRKTVSVSELLVLAKALEVPPALLLFPLMPDGDVEVLPDTWATSERAAEWLVGQARLETMNGDVAGGASMAVREPSGGEILMSEVWRRAREVPAGDAIRELWAKLRLRLEHSAGGANDEEAIMYGRLARDARQKRSEANARIRAAGGIAPDDA